MNKIIKLIVFLVLTNVIFNSCASSKEVATTITVESGEIPPDMKKEDFTLIGILKERRSRDKYTKSEFAKYTGNYVLCTSKELETKYNDINKYRYFMDYTVERNGVGTAYNSNIADRYFIYDRKENKKYNRNGASSFFKLEIRAYIFAVESARKK